ncbi:hypothetical protein TNCV_2572711 [Trichonephila clavipes]|nr:hypothetical protein TNCV_2572711 [Trichonephila clavipes]
MRTSPLFTHLLDTNNFVTLVEEIQWVEIWRAGRPTSRSTMSNITPEICSVGLVTHCNRKKCWCTIVYEPYVLVHSDRYSRFCSLRRATSTLDLT